ncbi:MAG: copper chaperone PCu(A)C [Candidatus Omnitrophica bacterium]|nr:copper chaperone PCu(A)C [Candidatus Omnitrophota bacterium]
MRNRLLITAVSLLACIYPASSHAMEPVQEDVLEISNAWVRGVPPVVGHTAAYMELMNPTEEEVVITAVYTAVAEHAEMHMMTMDNDRMTMRKVDEIRIPAGETFKLEPSGWHIMLIDLKGRLTAGDTVTLDLTFADGRHQGVSAVVKRMDMMAIDDEKGSHKGSHHGSMKGSHKGS